VTPVLAGHESERCYGLAQTPFDTFSLRAPAERRATTFPALLATVAAARRYHHMTGGEPSAAQAEAAPPREETARYDIPPAAAHTHNAHRWIAPRQPEPAQPRQQMHTQPEPQGQTDNYFRGEHHQQGQFGGDGEAARAGDYLCQPHPHPQPQPQPQLYAGTDQPHLRQPQPQQPQQQRQQRQQEQLNHEEVTSPPLPPPPQSVPEQMRWEQPQQHHQAPRRITISGFSVPSAWQQQAQSPQPQLHQQLPQDMRDAEVAQMSPVAREAKARAGRFDHYLYSDAWIHRRVEARGTGCVDACFVLQAWSGFVVWAPSSWPPRRTRRGSRIRASFSR
jgi:hypothetical protein